MKETFQLTQDKDKCVFHFCDTHPEGFVTPVTLLEDEITGK